MKAGKRPGCFYGEIPLRPGKKGIAVYREGKAIEKYSFVEKSDRKQAENHHFSIFFLLLQKIANRTMSKNTFEHLSTVVYTAPSLRIIVTNLETSFLQSNLEPINGGDGPDIDW